MYVTRKGLMGVSGTHTGTVRVLPSICILDANHLRTTQVEEINGTHFLYHGSCLVRRCGFCAYRCPPFLVPESNERQELVLITLFRFLLCQNRQHSDSKFQLCKKSYTSQNIWESHNRIEINLKCGGSTQKSGADQPRLA